LALRNPKDAAIFTGGELTDRFEDLPKAGEMKEPKAMSAELSSLVRIGVLSYVLRSVCWTMGRSTGNCQSKSEVGDTAVSILLYCGV
jgi:hypothetical protein